jgi:transposase InsO family protein
VLKDRPTDLIISDVNLPNMDEIEMTRPYTPQTHGKAERFIQTSLRSWAYAHSYRDSSQRADRLSNFLHN